MKKYIIILFILLIYYFLVVNNIISIPCIFHKITNLYCPGCGVSRMILSLLKLDFYQAFRYNQLLFILTPFFIILMINDIYSIIKKKDSLYKKIPESVWYILIIVLVLYGILRNIVPYFAPTVI